MCSKPKFIGTNPVPKLSLLMPTKQLTDRLISAASGPAELWDRTQPGFGLRISTPSDRLSKGRKTWQVMYRVNGGRKQRLKLGNYPDAQKMLRRALKLDPNNSLLKRDYERANNPA